MDMSRSRFFGLEVDQTGVAVMRSTRVMNMLWVKATTNAPEEPKTGHCAWTSITPELMVSNRSSWMAKLLYK
jgi:hypothetical protein